MHFPLKRFGFAIYNLFGQGFGVGSQFLQIPVQSSPCLLHIVLNPNICVYPCFPFHPTSWHHFTPIPPNAASHTLVYSSALPFSTISLHSSSHSQSRSLIHLHYPIKSIMHAYTSLSLHQHQLSLIFSRISAHSHPMQHHHTLLFVKYTPQCSFPFPPLLSPPSIPIALPTSSHTQTTPITLPSHSRDQLATKRPLIIPRFSISFPLSQIHLTHLY